MSVLSYFAPMSSRQKTLGPLSGLSNAPTRNFRLAILCLFAGGGILLRSEVSTGQTEPPAPDSVAEVEAVEESDEQQSPVKDAVASGAADKYADPFPGQADLDKATLAKLTAQQLSDLEKVVKLCESAIKKGLDPDNKAYAEDLMAASLFDNARRLSRVIFDQQPLDPRWPRVRRICLKLCERAIAVRPNMGSAQLLIARLHTLPGGDRRLAMSAAEQAIKALADDPDQQSDAYRIRGGLQEDSEASLADLNKAIELNPRNSDAWRSRGLYYMLNRQSDKAIADLEELLERSPDDTVAHQAIAQTLSEMQKYDEALEHLDEVLKKNPRSAVAHNLKARIAESKGDVKAAIESLNLAIEAQPQDLGALLYRARLRTGQEQFDLARSDVQRALQLRPQLPQAILLRSLISAAQNRLGEAIGDVQSLVQQSPDNVDLKLQLATYFEYDQRPRRAIKVFDEILAVTPDDWLTLRRRGDAWLSIGEQAKAIEDYRTAYKIQPEDSGILNNLAWVLSTSPDDQLRNGEEAIEFALKACEQTDYQAPHILSTLAASYAESGQMDLAIEWSEKAVKLDNNREPQLANELKSYQAGTPWREKQQVEENPVELDTALPVENASEPSLDDEASSDNSVNLGNSDESGATDGNSKEASSEENHTDKNDSGTADDESETPDAKADVTDRSITRPGSGEAEGPTQPSP